jgi:hypothetical protein
MTISEKIAQGFSAESKKQAVRQTLGNIQQALEPAFTELFDELDVLMRQTLLAALEAQRTEMRAEFRTELKRLWNETSDGDIAPICAKLDEMIKRMT